MKKKNMREIIVTIEAPADVHVRVIRKEAQSRLRLSPRGRIGKPVETFHAAFAATSKDGASAPADAVRDQFEAAYPSTGKNRKEAVEKGWRRALACVEEDFEVETAGGVEVFRKIVPAPISATRGARTTGARREI